MAMPLPGWVTSNDESVRDECRRVRGLAAAERARLLDAAVRAGAALIEANPQRERVLRWRDPLPPGSEAAWRRLRAEARRATR